MKKILWALGVTALAVASVGAQAQGGPATGAPQVVSTGEGEATVAADRATVFIAVETRAATAASAAADNAKRVRAVMDSLRATGLAADQLETANYSVSPQMPSVPSASPRTVTYVVTNSVVAHLRRIDDVGRVIDAALAKGANEISGLQFSSSKADSVRLVALAAAVADAKSQAEAMAVAAGGKLGQLLELTTSSPPIRPVMLSQTMFARVATPISIGVQTVSATVTGRWSFVANR